VLSPTRTWPKLRSSLEEFFALLKRWYALAIQDQETKDAFRGLAASYDEFCARVPIGPHVEQARMTPLHRDCLYLHSLYRRTRAEEREYRKRLRQLYKCNYQYDVLKLARHLVAEWSDEGEEAVNCFLSKDTQHQAFAEARRALASLTDDQKAWLHGTNAFDHVVALLVFLARSKMLMDEGRRQAKQRRFSVDSSLASHLASGDLSDELRTQLAENGCHLGASAEILTVDGAEDAWEIRDRGSRCRIEQAGDCLEARLTRDVVRVAVVVPVHQETDRLRSPVETLAGEDFCSLKLKQLEFLVDSDLGGYGKTELPSLEIALIFCGDDEATCRALQAEPSGSEFDRSEPESSAQLGDGARVCKSGHTEAGLGVYVIHAPRGSGVANSKPLNVKTGMQYALAMGCDFVCYTDADISTNLGQLGALFHEAVVHGADAVVGSRRLPGSWVYGRDPLRTQQSRVYNLLTRVLLGTPFRDTQAGFKLFTARAVKELMKSAFTDETMAFDSELLACLDRGELQVSEVPIVWFESPLESKSASIATAVDMLGGLCQQGRKRFASPSGDALDRMRHDRALRNGLVSLGTSRELHLLVSFCVRYYRLVSPCYLKRFGDSVKTLLYALSRNQLAKQEFEEFVDGLQQILNRLPDSRVLSFAAERYPQLLTLAHAGWQDPALLAPMLCFLLGSAVVSPFWPADLPAGIPSLHQLLQQEAASRGDSGPAEDALPRMYDEWLERYFGGSAQAHRAAKPGGARMPATLRGRRASARKLVQEGRHGMRGKVLHLVVPAISTTGHSPGWSSAAVDAAVWEISRITEKIAALQQLYKGVGAEHNGLGYVFHLMTGLTSDMILLPGSIGDPVSRALSRLGRIVCDTGVGVSLYAIDVERSGETSTCLLPFCFNKNGNLPVPLELVYVHHSHRDVTKELASGRKLKGTLLFLGFNAALQAIRDSGQSQDAFVGYTVATAKIPLEEYVFLLDALLRSAAGGCARCVAVGSRRNSESEVTNKPLMNHLRSAILNLAVRTLFPDLGNLSDTQASCKLFTPEMAVSVFESTEAPFFCSTGGECDVEMLQLSVYRDGSLVEVPISFYEGEGVKGSLGASRGPDLLSDLLRLRASTPSVSQRPVQVSLPGMRYTVQYIGSGTEHMVFKLERIDSKRNPPLVVKIPHESIDTEFFLSMDSLCFNRLRGMGLTRTTTRTDTGGLVTRNALFRAILAGSTRITGDWVASLREWREFNAVVLKGIRAYEGKTYKSSGYRHGLGIARFVAPYRLVSEDEHVVIGWGADQDERTLCFDGADHVIVMDFFDDTIRSYVKRRCGGLAGRGGTSAAQGEVAAALENCVRAAYEFSRRMAREAGLYDLDMNMWDDIGVLDGKTGKADQDRIEADDLRLLDPGELETMVDEAASRRCLELLWRRLRDSDDPQHLPEGIGAAQLGERVSQGVGDWDGELFDSFQFRHLDILMNQHGLSHEQIARIHGACAEEMQSYLETLLELCVRPYRPAQPSGQAGKGYWCVLKGALPESESGRIVRQTAAVMLGGDVQGKYLASGQNEFAAYVAQRGISVRSGPDRRGSATRRSRAIAGTFLVTSEDLVLDGREMRKSLFPTDDQGIPYRGAVATGINALSPAHWGADTRPRVVLLDAGAAVRMSMIGYAEQSKGSICLDGDRLWRQSAHRYGRIARQTGRDDLMVFGAADTLVDLASNSSLMDNLREFFHAEDPVTGRQAGVFFFQPPYDPTKGTPLIPQSRRDRDRWILHFLPSYLRGMRPFLPFLHLFDRQLGMMEQVDESGYGMWFRDESVPAPMDLRSALPAVDSMTAVSRYILISEAVRRHGGLRLPFLFILSRRVVDALYAFFSSLDAASAENLDWYRTVVAGFSSMPEPEFIQTHSRHLTQAQARSLYGCLRRIRREAWSEFHRRKAEQVSRAFYEDIVEHRAWWHAFESPVDLFDYYRLSRAPTERKVGEHTVKLFTDSTGTPNRVGVDVSIGEMAGLHRTLAVVVAGKLPRARIELTLRAPSTDVAGRSNYYPYLIYFPADHELASVPPIHMRGHELCIVDSGQCGPVVVKLPFVHPSKEATLGAAISKYEAGVWKPEVATVGALLEKPRGDHWTSTI